MSAVRIAMWFTPSNNVPIAILLSIAVYHVFPMKNFAPARYALSMSTPLPSMLCRSDILFSLWGAEPLINRPFCPDNTILDWFSGSFARSLLSVP